jgi:hypothetical protein
VLPKRWLCDVLIHVAGSNPTQGICSHQQESTKVDVFLPVDREGEFISSAYTDESIRTKLTKTKTVPKVGVEPTSQVFQTSAVTTLATSAKR